MSEVALGHLDIETTRFVRDLSSQLEGALGERLCGIYLHGSGALGGFSPGGASDVDLLVVISASLDELAFRRVSQILSRAAEHCPVAGGMECSVVTRQSAAEPSPAPRYELHVTTWSDIKVGDPPVDQDLPSYYAVCRARGVAAFGPDPATVFGEVDRKWVVQSWLADLRWAEQNAPPAYRVLNVCRVWRFVEEGVFSSKLEGAVWARDRIEDTATLDAAVAFQRGVPAAPVDRLAALSFVDSILKRVRFPA